MQDFANIVFLVFCEHPSTFSETFEDYKPQVSIKAHKINIFSSISHVFATKLANRKFYDFLQESS